MPRPNETYQNYEQRIMQKYESHVGLFNTSSEAAKKAKAAAEMFRAYAPLLTKAGKMAQSITCTDFWANINLFTNNSDVYLSGGKAALKKLQKMNEFLMEEVDDEGRTNYDKIVEQAQKNGIPNAREVFDDGLKAINDAMELDLVPVKKAEQDAAQEELDTGVFREDSIPVRKVDDAARSSVLEKRNKGEGIFNPNRAESEGMENVKNMFRDYGNVLKDDPDTRKLGQQFHAYLNVLVDLQEQNVRKPAGKQKFFDAFGKVQNLKDFLWETHDGVTNCKRLLDYAGTKRLDDGSGINGLKMGLQKISDDLGLDLDPDALQKPRPAAQMEAEPVPGQINEPLHEAGGRLLSEVQLTQTFEDSIISQGSNGEMEASRYLRNLQGINEPYQINEMTGKNEPQINMILGVMAVRSLTKAVRGSGTELKKRITPNQLSEEAGKLMKDPDARQFFKELRENDTLYSDAFKAAKEGRGGALETMFSCWLARKGKLPESEQMKRYVPTAQMIIEEQQKVLETAGTIDEKRNCLAHIAAARLAVNARRGYLGMDSRLKNQPDPNSFRQNLDRMKNTVQNMSENKLNVLVEKAGMGHGGKMLESYKDEVKKAGTQPLNNPGPGMSV